MRHLYSYVTSLDLWGMPVELELCGSIPAQTFISNLSVASNECWYQ